jgi:hypothetical protein
MRPRKGRLWWLEDQVGGIEKQDALTPPF